MHTAINPAIPIRLCNLYFAFILIKRNPVRNEIINARSPAIPRKREILKIENSMIIKFVLIKNG